MSVLLTLSKARHLKFQQVSACTQNKSLRLESGVRFQNNES